MIKKSDITEELLHSLCAKPEAKIILPHIDNPDKEKVIVVTGDPRSGTSLMMQSLRIAGFNISGDRFPMLNESSSEKEIDEDSIRHAIKMNPRGFYEVGGNVMGGFNKVSHEKFKNTVLKVISNGIKSTPSDLISHYILCLRDPKKISQSQINITNIMVSTGNGWDSPVNKASAFRYISGTGSMMVWLSEQSKDVQEKFVMVDNEDFRKNPTL